MADDGIHSLADLRPGDLMFGPIGGWVGVGVRLGHIALGEAFTVGRLNILHAAVVVQADERPLFGEEGASFVGARVAEAMPSGARERMLTADAWTPEYAFCRPPYNTPERGEAVAFHARRMAELRIPYSFLSYAALAAWKFRLPVPHLKAWISRRGPEGYPREAICSVLVDTALTLAGYPVFRDGRPEQAVTPGHLAGELLFRHPGTVWGGAGWEGPRVGPFTVAPQ